MAGSKVGNTNFMITVRELLSQNKTDELYKFIEVNIDKLDLMAFELTNK